jgi:hypothetical protein
MHLSSVCCDEMAKIPNSDLTCELQVIDIIEQTLTSGGIFKTKRPQVDFIFFYRDT